MGERGERFKGRQFTAEVILWAVRWYLQFPISYRDLELMLQRDIGGNGKSQPDRAKDHVVRQQGCVNADDLAGAIEQGTTEIARVDRGVGLDVVVEWRA